jgi:hypothetical protein
MSQVNLLKQMIETDEICIRCVPPPIKGLCRCEEPHYILIRDYLHLDSYGQRDYLNKFTKV